MPMLPFRNTLSHWTLYAGVLCLLAAFFFAGAKDLKLLADDDQVFRDHLAVSEDFTYFFSAEKEAASGRIVDEFILYLAYRIWGNDLVVFHVLVVVCHILASFLLAFLCHRLGAHLKLSFLAGALFLINIAHLQTVHWISALEYPIGLCCACATVLCYLRCEQEYRLDRWAVFYLCAALSLLAHPVTALVLPFGLYLSWSGGRDMRKALGGLLPCGLLLLPVLFFSWSLTGEGTTAKSALAVYAAPLEVNILSLAGDLLRTTLWLLGRLGAMAHWLPYNTLEYHPWEFWLGLGVLVALLLVIWQRREPLHPWALWMLLFIAPFVPVALVHADLSHFLYLATAGSSLLLAYLVDWLCGRVKHRNVQAGRLAYSLVLSALLLSSFDAAQRLEGNTNYNSGLVYLSSNQPLGIEMVERAIVENHDLVPLEQAHIKLVDGLLMQYRDYRPALTRAFAHYPGQPQIALLMAIDQYLNSDTHIGAKGLEKIRQVEKDAADSEYPAIYRYNVAVLSQHFGNWHSARGNHETALAAYDFSLRFAGANARSLRGKLYELIQLERHELAANFALVAIERRRDDPELIYMAAMILQEVGELSKALAVSHRALMIEPTAALFFLQGTILQQQGKIERALYAFEQALAKNPREARYYLSSVELLEAEGKGDAAIALLERATANVPSDPQLHFQLGNLYLADGRVALAVATYRRVVALEPTPQILADINAVLQSLNDLKGKQQP